MAEHTGVLSSLTRFDVTLRRDVGIGVCKGGSTDKFTHERAAKAHNGAKAEGKDEAIKALGYHKCNLLALGIYRFLERLCFEVLYPLF